jgi:protein tyrosine phosphatase type 4A
MNTAANTSVIEYGPLTFLIMEAPKASNLHVYLRECKKYNVSHIVRISEPSYSAEDVKKGGIELHVRNYSYESTYLSLSFNLD